MTAPRLERPDGVGLKPVGGAWRGTRSPGGVLPRAPSQRPSWEGGALYIIGALVATLVNILAQEIVRRFGSEASILAPMLAGTVAGFCVKYGFDKHVVFADPYRGRASELRKVVLYGLFSVGTTVLFWGSELAFWWLWQTPGARYAGAVIGLALGYAAKYRLDRAFVFRDGPV